MGRGLPLSAFAQYLARAFTATVLLALLAMLVCGVSFLFSGGSLWERGSARPAAAERLRAICAGAAVPRGALARGARARRADRGRL